jgi:hypothetical protein
MRDEDDDDSPVGPLPSASSPQLLMHLVDMLARGVRSPRGLQEALGVDPRTVRYYVHAATWLGLATGGPQPRLTPEGLALAFAGHERRARYARGVRTHPFVVELLGHAARPGVDDVLRAVARHEPAAAASTVARKASALRGLLAPCLDPGEDAWPELPDAASEDQLALPLGQHRPEVVEPPPARLAGVSFGPDLLRVLLLALLEHGELSLGHVRALLDAAGAEEAPIGTYVEHLLARGDAARAGDRLVVTAGAVRRADVAASTAGVILSDAGWRAHLDDVRAGRSPGRWRPWDRRLLGHDADRITLDADLAEVLRDRSLAGHPVTDGPAGHVPAAAPAPFVAVWFHAGLVVSRPSTLAQLWEGPPGVNRHLRNARHRGDSVGPPTLGYRPEVAHGGLLHPGETPPRTIPDGTSLRQRLVACVPATTMATALLLAHRASPEALELRLRREGAEVVRHRQVVGLLGDVLDSFGRSRGWIVARRPGGGLAEDQLVGLMVRTGLAVAAGSRLVLDEPVFASLRADDAADPWHAARLALGDALVAFLDARGRR